MRSDICFPLKVRLWTVQPTLSFSLIRTSMNMRYSYMQPASPIQGIFIIFTLTHQLSMGIHSVPGTILNAVTIWKGDCEPPLPTMEGSSVRLWKCDMSEFPVLWSSSNAALICSQKSWNLAVTDELLLPSWHTLLNYFTSLKVSLQYQADPIELKEWTGKAAVMINVSVKAAHQKT